MKKILLTILPLLLIVGCSKEPINYETTLVERDGVFYTKDTNKPYSGDVFSLDKNGEIEEEKTLKNGIVWNGKWTEWYENGQKKLEGTFKDGERDGLVTSWFENGQKGWEGTYKDGEPDGLVTQWKANGQKKLEGTFKDGERDGLYTFWYDNGQKQFEGIYKEGERNGLSTNWYENGQKKVEVTFKDGEFISSKCWDEDGNECECGEPSWEGCK